MKFGEIITDSNSKATVFKTKKTNRVTLRINRTGVKLNATQAARLSKALKIGAEKVRGL